MKKVEFDVIGMHCVSCSTGIKKVVQRMKPVSEAKVDLPTSKLYVEYDETATNNQEIIDMVARLGYKAVPVQE